MGEIKSAFERAMEKVETLGTMSPEEMTRRKEEEHTPIGHAVADRYLKHGYLQVFLEELGKYQGEAKDMVTRAALYRLVETIQLRNQEINERAMEAILAVKRAERISVTRDALKALHQEFKDIEQHRYKIEGKAIGKSERDLLHELRISGSAVGEINLEASQAWKKRGQELSTQFEGKLSSLKQELLQAVQEPQVR